MQHQRATAIVANAAAVAASAVRRACMDGPVLLLLLLPLAKVLLRHGGQTCGVAGLQQQPQPQRDGLHGTASSP